MVETKALIVEMYERYLCPPEEKEYWKKYDEECLLLIEEKKLSDISFVKIKEAVYHSVFFHLSPAPPERGGILGMKDGIICAFIPDRSEQETERAIYYPDVQFLNRCIENWAKEGIMFCGVIHSHPSGQTTLSGSDMEYIEELYRVNPNLEKTYFPLVLDGCDMMIYSVEKRDNKLFTTRVQIEIVD